MITLMVFFVMLPPPARLNAFHPPPPPQECKAGIYRRNRHLSTRRPNLHRLGGGDVCTLYNCEPTHTLKAIHTAAIAEACSMNRHAARACHDHCHVTTVT